MSVGEKEVSVREGKDTHGERRAKDKNASLR
jgi:hypothetical protein